MLKKIAAIGTVCCFLLIILIANSPSDLSFRFLSFVHHIPCGDKVLHFLLVGSTTFAVNTYWKNRTTKIFTSKMLLGSLVVLVFMTFEECTQALIPHRHFEILDLLCNYAGIFVASNLKLLK